MKINKLINTLGLKNIILTIFKHERPKKLRLLEKVDINKLSTSNYRGQNRFGSSDESNEKENENQSENRNQNGDKRTEHTDEKGFKIQVRRGNTKTVNEQTVSSIRERNVLNKKPLLTTDENRSKEDDLTQLKITQLRAQLRAHGLSSVGRKDVLIQRLQNYLTLKAGKTITHIPYDVEDDHLAANKSEHVETKHEKATDPELLDEKGDALELQKSKLACVIEDLRKEHSETPKLKLLPAQTVAEKPALRAEESPAQDCDSGIEDTTDSLTQKKESIIVQFSEAEPHGKGTANSGETAFVDDEVNCSKNEYIRDNSFVEPAVESVCEQPEGDVYVEYIQGLPHLTVPLPSRLEKCRFALRPVSHKVGDLIEMLKIEDHGIDRAIILNRCGVRIASTCAIDSLLDEPFWLQINDNKYEVIPPKRKKIDAEDLKRLSDVRTLVAQLYEALHVGEYHLYKEQELVTKIENLKFEISPLEMEKQELTKLAERKTVIATWVGLSLMAVQFGVLARLTWWEYSWDIMEPVTYFVTYGTTMAMYAYYCLTKSEYAFESIRDRLFLISIHKKAKRKNFDVDKYNQLKRQIAEAEYDLRRLRDPINLQLPPHIDRSQRVTPIEPPEGGSNTTGTNTRIVSAVTIDKKPVSFRLPFLEPKN